MEIIFLIAAIICLMQSAIILQLLRKERKTSARLRSERDEARRDVDLLKLQHAQTKQYHNKERAELRSELYTQREFTRQIEQFGNERVSDLQVALDRANAIVEMILENAPVEISITRDEARRLFVIK